MDFSMLIGWILAVILIVNGITVQKLNNFVDMPSVLIVVGGTIAGLVACYPFRILKEVPKHIAICLRGGKKYDVPKTVEAIVDLALVRHGNLMPCAVRKKEHHALFAARDERPFRTEFGDELACRLFERIFRIELTLEGGGKLRVVLLHIVDAREGAHAVA